MDHKEIVPGDTAYNKLYPFPRKLPKSIIFVVLILIILIFGISFAGTLLTF